MPRVTMKYYRMVNGEIKEVDLLEWAEGFSNDDRVIEKTQVGESEVSTVFIGIDCGYGFSPFPLIFETMIFGGDQDGYCRRYSTLEEAKAGHRETVNRLTS